MAPHSSTLARKIPWMEEPDGLQSMGSLRVGSNKKNQGESEHDLPSGKDRECIKKKIIRGDIERVSHKVIMVSWGHDPREIATDHDSRGLPRESNISADTFWKTE